MLESTYIYDLSPNERPNEPELGEGFPRMASGEPIVMPARTTEEYKAVGVTPSWWGEGVRGVIRGIDNLKASAIGLAAVSDKALRGGNQDYLENEYLETMRDIEFLRPTVSSFKDVNDFDSAVRYGVSTITENLAMFAPGVGIGGTAATISGAAAKTIFKNLVQKMGVEAATKLVAKRAAIAGAYAASAGIETGLIGGEMMEGGEISPGLAIAGGAVAGGFDAIPEVQIIKNTVGRKFARDLISDGIKKFGPETLKTALTEASTEGIQRVIELAAVKSSRPGEVRFTAEDWDDVWENVVGGAVGGGGVAAAAHGLSRLGDRFLGVPNDIKIAEHQRQVEEKVRENLSSMPGAETATITIPPITDEGRKIERYQELQDELEKLPDDAPRRAEIEAELRALNEEEAIETEKAEASKIDTKLQPYIEDFQKKHSGAQPDARQLKIFEQLAGIEEKLQTTPPEASEYQTLTEKQNRLYAAVDILPAPRRPVGQELVGETQGTAVERASPGIVEQWKKSRLDTLVERLIPSTGDQTKADIYKKQIRNSFEPFSDFLAAINAKVQTRSDFIKSARKNRPAVPADKNFTWMDDSGQIFIVVPEPRSVERALGAEVAASTTKAVVPKMSEEEVSHALSLQILKDQHRAEASKEKLTDYINKRFARIATDVLAESPDTIKEISQAYFPQGGEFQSEAQIGSEFLRMLIQRMRTGRLTEDYVAIEAAARMKDKGARELIKTIIRGLKTVREALARWIHPSTSTPEIQEFLKRANEYANKFEILGKQVEAAIPPISPPVAPVVPQPAPAPPIPKTALEAIKNPDLKGLAGKDVVVTAVDQDGNTEDVTMDAEKAWKENFQQESIYHKLLDCLAS